MLNIAPSTVLGVAADTRAALKATDQALLAHAQLFVSLLEGAAGAELPIAITQDLYSTMAAHGGSLVEGRGKLRHLVTRLTAVKDGSDQREVAIGCPNGLPEVERKAGDFFTDARGTAPQRA